MTYISSWTWRAASYYDLSMRKATLNKTRFYSSFQLINATLESSFLIKKKTKLVPVQTFSQDMTVWINSIFFKFSYVICNRLKRNIGVLLTEGSDIELAKLVIKCPYCQWLFEVRPPDAIHSDYSFRKPSQISVHGEVIKRSLRCLNPRCGEKIEIYWFSRANHFPKIFSLQPQETHDN